MSALTKIVHPLDLALVAFLIVVGSMTHDGSRPARLVMPPAIVRMQGGVGAHIRSVFSPPVSTWVSGLFLGDDRAFSPAMKEAFRRTGTSHLTAVSGYNIVVLISVLGTASARLPVSRRVRVVGGIAAVILFVLLTGAPASVIRAAGMAGIALAARLLGRPVKAMRTFLFAVCIMTAIRPELLLHDLGFQLSALATFGLLAFTIPIESMSRRLMPQPFSEPFAQTTAATVAVSPLIAVTFGTFSLVTLPVNIVLGTAIPFMMAVSGILLAIGAVSLPVAQTLSTLCKPVLMLPLGLITLSARVPHAEVYGPVAMCAASALSILVLTLSFFHHRRHPYVKED